MKISHSIICGIDGSKESRAAAGVAASLAGSLGLRLVLAHVAEDWPTFPYGDARLVELQRRAATEDASQMLQRVGSTLPGDAWEPKVVFGPAVDALIELGRAEAAELLVIGSRGRRPVTAALLGSVSGALANMAECPVVVVPSADAAARFLKRDAIGSPIVCGVDGSPGSERARSIAAGLADRIGCELLPVFVGGRGDAPTTAVDSIARIADADPAAGLRGRALDDGALISVGSRGRDAVSAAVLGSVSRVLAATAPVPVLVVPPTSHPAEPVDGDVVVELAR
jgi:nucleotide-binding universal stress UspA family protein